MQLIIDTSNTKLSVRNKAFFIEKESKSRIIAPKRVSSIAITSNVNLNASVIKLAANRQIPIYFFNNFGTLQARICSPFLVNMAELRRKQLYFYDSPEATQWVLAVVDQKTQLQLALLKQLVAKKPRLQEESFKRTQKMISIMEKKDAFLGQKMDEARQSILGIEGSLSKLYFGSLRLLLPPEFVFEKRSRRPALDYFNAGLNYLYGMTYSVVESGIYAKGLDPYAGFLHTDNYRKPNLVYDIIEPVRPLIDKHWVSLVQEKKILPDHFIPKEQGYWLSKAGKRVVIPSFNEYLYKRFKMGQHFYRLKDFIYQLSNNLGNLIEVSIQKS